MDEQLSKPAGAVRRWLLCQACQHVIKLLIWTGPDKLRCEACGELVDLAQLEIEGKIYSTEEEPEPVEPEGQPEPDPEQIERPVSTSTWDDYSGIECKRCHQEAFQLLKGVCIRCVRKKNSVAAEKSQRLRNLHRRYPGLVRSLRKKLKQLLGD